MNLGQPPQVRRWFFFGSATWAIRKDGAILEKRLQRWRWNHWRCTAFWRVLFLSGLLPLTPNIRRRSEAKVTSKNSFCLALGGCRCWGRGLRGAFFGAWIPIENVFFFSWSYRNFMGIGLWICRCSQICGWCQSPQPDHGWTWKVHSNIIET